MQESIGTMTVLLAVIINAAYLWLPANISYIFVGKHRLQKIQSRFAFLLTVAVFLNIGLYSTLYSLMVLMLGLVNWALMVVCIVRRDVLNKASSDSVENSAE